MDMIITIIVAIAAFILGALLTWLFQRPSFVKQLSVLTERLQQQAGIAEQAEAQNKTLQSEKELLIQQVSKAESRSQLLEEEHKALKRFQMESQVLQSQLAMFKEKFRSAEEKLENQKKEMEQLGEHFKFEFRNLAQNILEEKTEKFTQLNEEKMTALITPLKAQLVEFKQKVEETYDKESKERFSLGKEVQRLMEMSQQVSLEANNLTTALKGNTKMQGNWGEMILESLLENSGLTKGREYFVQEFIKDNSGNIIKDETGKGLQPDITILYPDNRKVIIDSKVSLVAWEQYLSCEGVDGQQQFLQQHIRSLRSHIDGLSKKNYPRYAQALDYVLLFIPIEPAFLEAVKSDVLLWKYAYDKKILLVSPTNLFAVLRIVADLWKVEQQNRHALNVADKAGALYDKFVGFIDNLEVVGKKLNEASGAYDTAFKQLSTGRGNIINRVEELRKMGANTSKQITERLLDEN